MTSVSIGSWRIGEGSPCYVIAEVGSNHDGKLEQALELLDAAANAQADAVKFQSFVAEEIASPREEKLYGFFATPGRAMPMTWWGALKRRADHHGIHLLSTPFDSDTASQLRAAGVPAFKIASGDLTYHTLIEHVGRLVRPTILSTGMATMDEVAAACEVFFSTGNRSLILLQCVSNYPAKIEDANIRAMLSMQERFHVPVGYSDHAPGWTVVLGAVALGAKVIEKHITLSRMLEGPDHSHSLEPAEFATMVRDIRGIEAALGDGVKRPAEDEMPERKWARRGVYARFDIPAGATLGPEMLYCVRPCVGVSAEHVSQIIGRSVRHPVTVKDPILHDVLRDSGCTQTRSVSEGPSVTQARSASEGPGFLVTAS